MRSLLRFHFLLILLGLTVSAHGQAQRPQFRPAVLGSGPESLINRIDAQDLLKKGQKDGAVMFCAVVAKSGEAMAAWTYRAMPETNALEAELEKRLEGVKFTPAIYQHQPVDVLLFATVFFSTAKPHIRILLNQDAKELKEVTDFIAPQPVFGQDSKFSGLRPPETGPSIPLTAVVDLRLKVDRDGQLNDLQVLGEEPPLLGYGEAATENFRYAKFIPAFRNGDATESEVAQPICYKPID